MALFPEGTGTSRGDPGGGTVSEAKIRTLPTTMVTGYWDDGSVSEYPEQIKIVMANGDKVLYRIEVRQPKPNTLTPSEMARIMENHIFGGYKNDR